MKNKRKQILLSSLVMLVVAAMALTTTTLAWFSKGNSGVVDDFEFTAEAASGILFSTDVSDWKSTITAEDIAGALTKAPQTGSSFGSLESGSFVGSEFIPLSTTGAVSNGAITLYNADAQEDGSMTTSVYAATNNNFYVFNLYVKNDGEAKTLNLKNFTATAQTGDLNKGTEKAVRFAILDNGNTSTNVAPATLITNASALVGATSSLIFEPNSTSHIEAATNAGATGKMAYKGVKAVKANATTANGFITDADAVADVTTIVANDTAVASLAANSVTKLTIYVWVEGQDCDCLNDIAQGGVIGRLVFEVPAAAAD